MESAFEYYDRKTGGLGSWDDGRQELIKAGFTELDTPKVSYNIIDEGEEAYREHTQPY